MIKIKVVKVNKGTNGTFVTADMETGARVHFVMRKEWDPVEGQSMRIAPSVLRCESTAMSAARCFRSRNNPNPFGGVISSGREW